jgi:ATP-dependent DNA helicase DinG
MNLRRSVDAVFAPHGSLARVVEPFEWRPQQATMALRVADALESAATLFVEAPTGVGKSLAYLVPGALWARENQQVLLVSTHTRNLQDQIVRRDWPFLRRLTDRRIELAVLKGRSNYLCRRRWEQARGDLAGTTDGEILVRLLEGWTQFTESGDFEEGPAVPGRLLPLLGRVASDAHFCASSLCTPDGGCFFKLSRRRARDAHVVLINHALLVLDLLHETAGLPPWEGLVIDEAHHLPRIAADAMARSVSARGWLDAAMRLGGQGDPGATDRIRKLVHPGGARAEFLRRIRGLEADLGVHCANARAFFDELVRQEGFPAIGARARYRLGAGRRGPFPASSYPLLEEATELLARHDGLLRELRHQLGSKEEEEAADTLAEIDGDLEGMRRALDAFGFLLEADDAGWVYWFESDARDGASLHGRPLTLSGALGEKLGAGRGLVLTSATLAIEGSTRFFAQQCGLQETASQEVLSSPFSIAEQVRMVVPGWIPDPNEEGYEEAVAEGIRSLASGVPRKLLVLFTAHEMLRRTEERVRSHLEDRGIRVYAQGRDASRSALAAAFQGSDRAVLLGAASFWEGVDFPGEELEMLVMVRLPFPVPIDPFVEAYAERLREDGRDAFEEYMIPEAIVRFRQGFGRLIRRRGDRGVFLVFDPRVLRRGYGRRFLDAVGVEPKVVGSWDACARSVAEWFETRAGTTREGER